MRSKVEYLSKLVKYYTFSEIAGTSAGNKGLIVTGETKSMNDEGYVLRF